MSAGRLSRDAERYTTAGRRLAEALNEPSSNPLAIDGSIQRFEFSFELGWKLLKELLQEEGLQVVTPREAIRAAYQASLVSDEDTWLTMIEYRNLTSHTYNEERAAQVYATLPAFLPAFEALITTASRYTAPPATDA